MLILLPVCLQAHLVGQESASDEPSASEQRPLLRSFPNPSRYGSQQTSHVKTHDRAMGAQVKHYLATDISTRWTDLVFIINFFISGMIDAGAFNAYECFCSMQVDRSLRPAASISLIAQQTGNTVFAALGVSDLPVSSPTLAWTKSVVSVVSFLAGAAAVGVFHRRFGERKRWVLGASFIIQAIHIAAAGVLVQRGKSSGAPGLRVATVLSDRGINSVLPANPGFPWTDLIPIALLASQAAAKVIASRALQCRGMPCIALTNLYVDLVSDPGFFSAGLFSNAKRNRQGGGVVFYFIGAVVGGVCASHPIGFSGDLFIAAALQLGTAITWLMWKPDEDENEADEEGIAPRSSG